MIEKAAVSEADMVFLDLEDSVAYEQKSSARQTVISALGTVEFGSKIVVVRVNDASTPFMYRDVIDIVSSSSSQLDCLMVPKVETAGDVAFVDVLLNQLESEMQLETSIGLEIQIETPQGSVNMTEIARATKRIETLIFGPGDYAASLGVIQPEIGTNESAYPGHQWHYILSQLVNNARGVGADAIDGPYGNFHDRDGYQESCRRARLLGADGKWCIHPSQIEIANVEFSPNEAELEYAERILESLRQAADQGQGATSLDGKMIDEASRKMAEKILVRGRAAGLI